MNTGLPCGPTLDDVYKEVVELRAMIEELRPIRSPLITGGEALREFAALPKK